MVLLSDLTLIPPPKTPDTDEYPLIDFASPNMTAPPPGFLDANGVPTTPQGAAASSTFVHQEASSSSAIHQGLHDHNETEIIALVEDLPPDIREHLDRMVMNDEELGSQIAAIDAFMLGKILYK